MYSTYKLAKLLYISNKYLYQLTALDVNFEIFHRFRHILNNAPID